MQEAEASMAEDKGVPVVRLDCSELKGTAELKGTLYADLSDFVKMAGWAELMFITIDKDRDGFVTRAEVAGNQKANDAVQAEWTKLRNCKYWCTITNTEKSGCWDESEDANVADRDWA